MHFASFLDTVLKSVAPHAEFLKYLAWAALETSRVSVNVLGVKSQGLALAHLHFFFEEMDSHG